MQIKTFVFAASLSLLTTINLPAFAQTSTTVANNKIENTEKINNIKKLLDITGSRNISRKIITQLINSLKAEYSQSTCKVLGCFYG